MKITEKDVGRKVRLRNGMVTMIISYDQTLQWPVRLGDPRITMTVHGKYPSSDESYRVNDIIEFVD